MNALLTLVIPTYNRPKRCLALVRMLRDCGMTHPVVLADSSSAENFVHLRKGCGGMATIRHFDPHVTFVDKLSTVIGETATPFVALHPDDDLLLPHALDACLSFMKANSDYAAAHGYVVDFDYDGDAFDFTGVRWFTPTIGEDEPLQRMYHLLRRYQPFHWAVFRREAIQEAVEAGRAAPGLTVLREMATMITLALSGKIARLPYIYYVRGAEESHESLADTNPFFALMANSDDFADKFKIYRDLLIERVIALPRPAGDHAMSREDIAHAVNLMHTIHFMPELDRERLKAEADLLLCLPPRTPTAPTASTETLHADPGDLVHEHGPRRFTWRKSTLNAEPRDEITITQDEITRVEQQLLHYQEERPAA